jgi:hypothetical protein
MKQKLLPAFGWMLLLHVFTAQSLAAVASDKLSGALPITVINAPINDTNPGATAEKGEPSHGEFGTPPQNTVWYSFKPKLSGYYVVASSGVSTAIYTGSSMSNIVPVTSVPTSPTFLSAGTKYLIVVDTPGPIQLQVVQVFALATAPLRETKGQYEGPILFPSNSVAWQHRDNGKMSLVLTQAGDFSGLLYTGGGSYRFKGRLNFIGAPTYVSLDRGKLPPLQLLFALGGTEVIPIPGGQEYEITSIVGQLQPINGGGPGVPFELKARRKASLLSTTAKKYVMAHAGGSSVRHSSIISGGITISSRGGVSGVTVMPDGGLSTYAVSAFGNDLNSFQAIAMQRLYGGTGHMLSVLKFSSTAASTADVNWARSRSDKRWADSVQGSHQMTLTGGQIVPYDAPDPGEYFWSDITTSSSGQFSFYSLSTLTLKQNNILLSTNNVISRNTAGALQEIPSLSAKVNTASGYVSGSAKFQDGSSSVPITFRGFIYPPYLAILGTANTRDQLWQFAILPGF